MVRKALFEHDFFADIDPQGINPKLHEVTPLYKSEFTENNMFHETVLLGRPQSLRILTQIARERGELDATLQDRNCNGETPLEYGQSVLKNLEHQKEQIAAQMQAGNGPDTDQAAEKAMAIVAQHKMVEQTMSLMTQLSEHMQMRQKWDALKRNTPTR